MKIGIIGSGDVGRTLAAGFVEDGHEVAIGTRDPSKIAAWSSDHSRVAVADLASAARHGEVVVLAVKGSAALDALALAGPDLLRGKIVIDATNPVADEPPVDGVLRSTMGPNESALERAQQAYPDARFVKAFNSVGVDVMVRPKIAGGPPTMFVCGNDAEAKRVVRELLETFGWDVADMGSARAAAAIESLAILWCIPGFREGRWTHAFRLLRDGEGNSGR